MSQSSSLIKREHEKDVFIPNKRPRHSRLGLMDLPFDIHCLLFGYFSDKERCRALILINRYWYRLVSHEYSNKIDKILKYDITTPKLIKGPPPYIRVNDKKGYTCDMCQITCRDSFDGEWVYHYFNRHAPAFPDRPPRVWYYWSSQTCYHDAYQHFKTIANMNGPSPITFVSGLSKTPFPYRVNERKEVEPKICIYPDCWRDSPPNCGCISFHCQLHDRWYHDGLISFQSCSGCGQPPPACPHVKPAITKTMKPYRCYDCVMKSHRSPVSLLLS